MTTFLRSSEYRKQARTTFLTNKAQVRKQLTGVSANSGAHAPAIQIIIPTTTSVILPGVPAAGNVSAPAGTVDVVSTAVFEEDFSTYTNSSDWRSNLNGWYFNEYSNVTSQHIDTTVADPDVSSDRTLRYEWSAASAPGGCNNKSLTFSVRSWQDGRSIASISPLVKELWVEMRVRFASDWNTIPPPVWGCTGNPDHKLFRAHVASQGVVNHFGIKDNVNPSRRWSFHAPRDADNQAQGGDSFAATPFSDDEWNVVRMHMRISTNETTPDGRVYMAVNGRRLTSGGFTGDDIATIEVDPGGTGNRYDRFRFLWFGLNRNHSSDIIQRMWWSRVRIYDSDPGWIEGYPNQPIDHTASAIIDSSTPGSGAGWTVETGASNFTTVIPADSGAWKSPNAESRIAVSAGTVNGATVVRSVSPVTGAKKSLYFALFVEPESNFEGNNLNRIFSFEHENKDGTTFVGTNVNFAGLDAGALDLQMYLSDLQGDPLGPSGIRNLTANVGSAPIVRNIFYMIEGHLIQNTPGVSDGEVHVWVDGMKRLEYTNVRWSDSTGAGDNKWTEVQLNVINGPGPNSTVGGAYQIDYDHLYVTVN